MDMACHACGESVIELSGPGTHSYITSDCRPWPWQGYLDLCTACGTVQKRRDTAWAQAVADIYASYDPYPLGARAEQAIFSDAGTAPRTRSHVVLSQLIDTIAIPHSGRMLDIGCGNGALLKSFGQLRPNWKLNGADLGTRFAEEIRDLPGVEGFHIADPVSVPGIFDLMTMCHVLEHIPNPSAALSKWSPRLSAASGLLVEVPDLTRNPFDLVIVDHISHFTKASLARALARGGFGVSLLKDDWIAKELIVYAKPGSKSSARATPAEIDDVRRDVERQLAWLSTLLAQAEKAHVNAPFGIFGTAIGATWLHVSLHEAAAFFVDEDPNRIGGSHLGKPILAMKDVPIEATVALPLPPTTATAVAARLAAHGIATVLPPAQW
jgi:hypothetical protein